MALFKIYRGNEANLPAKLTDGYAYFCPDTGGFFIDYTTSTGQLSRKQINAASSAALHYSAGGLTVEIDPADIAMKDDVSKTVPINQGTASANKLLKVGEDGNVTTATVASVLGNVTWGNLAGES